MSLTLGILAVIGAILALTALKSRAKARGAALIIAVILLFWAVLPWLNS